MACLFSLDMRRGAGGEQRETLQPVHSPYLATRAVYYGFASKDEPFFALRLAAWASGMRATPDTLDLKKQGLHAVTGYFADLDPATRRLRGQAVTYHDKIPLRSDFAARSDKVRWMTPPSRLVASIG